MINRHQFQITAKKFRGGRITLKDFTDIVFANDENEANENPGSAEDSQGKAQSHNPRNVSSGKQLSKNSLRALPTRSPESHKGDFGRVLAIGGSEGMGGAIGLTGLAALRTGSGLVRVAVPEMIQSLVAALNPCLMTMGCMADGDGFHGASAESISHHSEWADVVAIGPGMGRGGAQQWIMKKVYEETPQPMVVDADGLNGLADGDVDLSQHQGDRILTPHPGEFQRIAKTEITNRKDLEAAARDLAESANVVLVLKGNKTFVTDGSVEYRNETGNPGMATAGAGDVLTGIITSLIGQGLAPFEASALGVYLHGMAGDFAAESVGESSLIATDIVEFISVALKAHASQSHSRIGF